MITAMYSLSTLVPSEASSTTMSKVEEVLETMATVWLAVAMLSVPPAEQTAVYLLETKLEVKLIVNLPTSVRVTLATPLESILSEAQEKPAPDEASQLA